MFSLNKYIVSLILFKKEDFIPKREMLCFGKTFLHYRLIQLGFLHHVQRSTETARIENRNRGEIAIRSVSGTILYMHVRDESRQLDRILQKEVD